MRSAKYVLGILLWVETVFGGPIVTTSTGKVEGIAHPTYNVYQGIPFAKAPLGELRFHPAEPVDSWSGVLNASTPGPACLQPDDPLLAIQSEDCLFLNVFTPANATAKNATLLPVMVYIYGGSFMSGSGSGYNTSLLVEDGVVVFTLNYRLGPLGFLSHPLLATDNAYNATGGMNGLTDQIEALKWIKANAAHFGGDAGNITLFGESAGGLSVCMLTISPLAKNLFKQVMFMSGPCNGPWAPAIKTTGYTIGVGLTYGLNVSTLSALREVDADVLRTACSAIPFCGTPSVDDYVLSALPKDLYASKVPLNAERVVNGFTSSDGLLTVISIFRNSTLPETADSITRTLATYFPDNLDVVQDLWTAYKPEGEVDSEGTKTAYRSMNADVCITCPARKLATEIGSTSTPTYVYEFAHNDIPQYAGQCWHGFELNYVFGYTLDPNMQYPPPIPSFSRVVRSLWTSYAIDGVPTGSGSPVWPLSNGTAVPAVRIENDDISIIPDYKVNKCGLWEQLDYLSKVDFCWSVLGDVIPETPTTTAAPITTEPNMSTTAAMTTEPNITTTAPATNTTANPSPSGAVNHKKTWLVPVLIASSVAFLRA